MIFISRYSASSDFLRAGLLKKRLPTILDAEEGISLLEVLVSISLTSIVLASALAALPPIKNNLNKKHQALKLELTSLRLSKELAPDHGQIRGLNPIWLSPEGNLRIIRLRLDRLIEKEPASSEHCYKLRGGEVPKAWLRIDSSGLSVLRATVGRGSCPDISNIEKIASIKTSPSLWPSDTFLSKETLVAVNSFYELSFSDETLWKSSLISRDKLALVRGIEHFTVTEDASAEKNSNQTLRVNLAIGSRTKSLTFNFPKGPNRLIEFIL